MCHAIGRFIPNTENFYFGKEVRDLVAVCMGWSMSFGTFQINYDSAKEVMSQFLMYRIVHIMARYSL